MILQIFIECPLLACAVRGGKAQSLKLTTQQALPREFKHKMIRTQKCPQTPTGISEVTTQSTLTACSWTFSRWVINSFVGAQF